MGYSGDQKPQDRKFDKNGRLLMLNNEQLEKANWVIEE